MNKIISYRLHEFIFHAKFHSTLTNSFKFITLLHRKRFEIHVSDMVRACNFYEYVFNQKLSELPNGDPSIKMMAFTGDMNSHGANGALVQHPMKLPSTDGILIYFSCDDCSVQEKLALEKGGQVFKSKFSIGPNGFISIIGDSEGNAIGLHSFV